MSTTIQFNSVNFDKRQRNHKNKQLLTLDASLNSEEKEDSFINMISDENSEVSLDDILSKEHITEQIACPDLHQALKTLTPKQLEVIHLAYAEGMSDTQIGMILNKSQQAVSKVHKKALQKIFSHINEKTERR